MGAYSFMVRNPEEKEPERAPRRIFEDNIKKDLVKLGLVFGLI